MIETAQRDGPRSGARGLTPLAPVDTQMEVCGAGVAYERSLDARREECGDREAYRAVYDAARPEQCATAGSGDHGEGVAEVVG